MEVDIPLPPLTGPPDRRRFVKIEATIGPLIEDGGKVVTQPPSGETVVGQPASFAVSAAGEGLTYQWYKDDQPIPEQTAAVYAIAAATTSDVGNYSVVVTNAAGSVTSRKVFFLVTE
jgi:membrane carboxypeptidase/penicillin-binding protein PbpC